MVPRTKTYLTAVAIFVVGLVFLLQAPGAEDVWFQVVVASVGIACAVAMASDQIGRGFLFAPKHFRSKAAARKGVMCLIVALLAEVYTLGCCVTFAVSLAHSLLERPTESTGRCLFRSGS